jgi:hypothetical protein
MPRFYGVSSNVDNDFGGKSRQGGKSGKSGKGRKGRRGSWFDD